jgi:hypothetical protein
MVTSITFMVSSHMWQISRKKCTTNKDPSLKSEN